MAQTIARRSLIIGGASAATVTVVPLAASAQDAITVDQFRALSARLKRSAAVSSARSSATPAEIFSVPTLSIF